MKDLRPYDGKTLHHLMLNEKDSFHLGDWQGDTEIDNLLLLPNSPHLGRKLADKVEMWLSSLGMKGATCEETSEQYHQNIVGIDAWSLDLKKKSFTRIDDFEVRHSRTLLVPIAHPDQIYNLFIKKSGSIEAKKYNI